MEIKLSKKTWKSELKKLEDYILIKNKNDFDIQCNRFILGYISKAESFQQFVDYLFRFGYFLHQCGIEIGKMPKYYTHSKEHMNLWHYKYKLHDNFVGCRGCLEIAHYKHPLPASIDKKQNVDGFFNIIDIGSPHHPLDQLCSETATRSMWAYYEHTLPNGKRFKHTGVLRLSPFDNPLIK